MVDDTRLTEKTEVTTVALQRDVAQAAAKYISSQAEDPIWYDVTDLVNDVMKIFLWERGVRLEAS